MLDIAARGDCVEALALRIDAALDVDKLPDVAALKREFLPTTKAHDDVTIPPPDPKGYNGLLSAEMI